MLMAKKPDMSN